MNLFEKLLKISEEVGTVSKNITIAIGNGKYKAVGEVDVINAVKPLEVKYGVFSYPVKHEVIESKELEKRNGGVDQFVRVKVLFRFVDVHKPTDFIEVETIGDGVDSGDKASGKAQTYADKYALLKAYKIATGDDPDQEASQEYNKKVVKVFTDEERIAKINEISELLGNDPAKVAKWFKFYDINHSTITLEIANKIIAQIKEKQNG